HVRSKMEYRGALWLNRLAPILSYGSVFATIGILLARFDTLGGWTWPALALLFLFPLLSSSLFSSLLFFPFLSLSSLFFL
ncbi:ABC transporter permease, partial [Rhizobium ruizarguesonis]